MVRPDDDDPGLPQSAEPRRGRAAAAGDDLTRALALHAPFLRTRPLLCILASSAALLSMSCQPPVAASRTPAEAPVAAAPPPSRAEATPPASPAPRSSTPAFTPPATKAGSDGNLVYIDPPKYDAATVADVFPGAGSPEAAVVHYLASRVRRDDRYREVMSAKCSSDCLTSLAEHDTWTFRAFRLVSKTPSSPGRLWIEVWMEIEYKGEVESGTDEFTVDEEMGEFRIYEVPT